MFATRLIRHSDRCNAVRRRPRRARSLPFRAALQSEHGVTVVEMLVASLILAVGVAGAATLFVASNESIVVARGQADATDLAAGELEQIRALAYPEVGIAVSADGYVSMVDGRPTVTEAGQNRVEAVGSESRQGIDFRIGRSVTWARVGDEPHGYKVIVVDVRWESAGLERTVTVQTGRYEESAEP